MPPGPLLRRFSDEYFRRLPARPGVYFFRDAWGRLLYVGKAKSLRVRLRTYARVRAGDEPQPLVALVSATRTIHWLLCRTETEALRVEADLLRALRPPFNIAGTDPERYAYLSLRVLPSTATGQVPVDLALDAKATPSPGTIHFGCFPQRGVTHAGFVALLRLLVAAQASTPRFQYPGALRDRRPPYRFEASMPPAWVPSLKRFLAGRRLELLRTLSLRLIENDNVPTYLRHSLQRDLNTARRFFRHGPAGIRRLRAQAGLGGRGLLAPAEMDALLVFRISRRFPEAALWLPQRR